MNTEKQVWAWFSHALQTGDTATLNRLCVAEARIEGLGLTWADFEVVSGMLWPIPPARKMT